MGKSSLINLLTDRKELAHTSGKPGKTQSLNYYLINESWYLVDLPGYGYAKVAKNIRKQFGQMIEDYILKSEFLACVFVLIDANIPPQKRDIEFVNWLGENGMPFCLIFTKTDRQTPAEIEVNMNNVKEALLEYWNELPPVFVSSATKRLGREEILTYINQVAADLAANA